MREPAAHAGRETRGPQSRPQGLGASGGRAGGAAHEPACSTASPCPHSSTSPLCWNHVPPPSYAPGGESATLSVSSEKSTCTGSALCPDAASYLTTSASLTRRLLGANPKASAAAGSSVASSALPRHGRWRASRWRWLLRPEVLEVPGRGRAC